jgi:glycerol-3-phosphate acyltransferase PlsY
MPFLRGAIALWPASGLIIFPVMLLIYYFVGYASVTSMLIGAMSIIIFGMRAIIVDAPWAYVFYGVFAEILILISLRPNIKRLREGNERLIGYRAKKMKK